MNIQQFIDRKRIAGAREHEGRQTDWAGWTRERYISAAASELLDACAYVQRAMEVAQKTQDAELFHTASFIFEGARKLLFGLEDSDLEAACQEAEQEAEKGIVNCPYCNAEFLLWDELPDNSYIPDDVNVICCKECCEEFDVVIHNQFEFEVLQVKHEVKQEAKQ